MAALSATGDYGYSETALAPDLYAVTFVSPSLSAHGDPAQDYGLDGEKQRVAALARWRAAELALAQGYPAFQVESETRDADVHVEDPPAPPPYVSAPLRTTMSGTPCRWDCDRPIGYWGDPYFNPVYDEWYRRGHSSGRVTAKLTVRMLPERRRRRRGCRADRRNACALPTAPPPSTSARRIYGPGLCQRHHRPAGRQGVGLCARFQRPRAVAPADRREPHRGRPARDRVGCVRNFTLSDGGRLRERLLTFSDLERSFTYNILESPLPLRNYLATFTCKPVTEGNKTFVEWSASFDAAEADEPRLLEQVGRNTFAAGIAALREGARRAT